MKTSCNLYILVLMLLSACGGPGIGELVRQYEVGPTTVNVYRDARPWQDTPEALLLMQQYEEVPPETWDTTIHLIAPDHSLVSPFAACTYSQYDGSLVVRTTDYDQPAWWGCLPHEFAHRWKQVELGTDTSSVSAHDNEWLIRYQMLEELAKRSWLARREQSDIY